MKFKPMWLSAVIIAGFVGPATAQTAAVANAATGTVVSTEQSGPYTYVQLNLDGSNVWYAVPSVDLEAGDPVIVPQGMLMKNFHSKTLDRTFDAVYFADGISKAGAVKEKRSLPAGHPPIHNTLPPGHPPITALTNSACCPVLDEPVAGGGSTNEVTQ